MTISSRDMTKTALVAAITSVSAFLSIPLGPVPITMQSCVVLVAGPVLGARLGALSQIIYLAMGFVGLPVFAGGRAGMGVVMTPTFGYLLGFVAAAYLTGLMTDR
ncbi:MAG: biotin transporter BioY, partial [Candidatus Latescibacteria bacterium]|nr:biotin transporter BioY [Candidatus Latescibacterota bacterium]